MSEQKVINDAVEFIDFIKSNDSTVESFNTNFPPIWGNLLGMRESLNRRPCSCGGINPDAVLAERRRNLENFYVNWLSQLDAENLEKLKNSMPSGLILKSEDNILLEP